MKLRKLIVGLALAAAPMQASIISSMTDPGLSLLQNFSTPSLTKNVSIAPVISSFSGVTLNTTGRGLVYDTPSGFTCHDSFAPDADCISNFTGDAGYGYASVTSTDLTFKLTAPTKMVAFWAYFDPTLGFSTKINVFDSSNGLLETTTIGKLESNSANWYKVTEGSNIDHIQIAGVNATTEIDNLGHAYGLVLSHIETATVNNPEPATVMMLGLGLGALGVFARRRKA
jgi:hypothetical protein